MLKNTLPGVRSDKGSPDLMASPLPTQNLCQTHHYARRRAILMLRPLFAVHSQHSLDLPG